MTEIEIVRLRAALLAARARGAQVAWRDPNGALRIVSRIRPSTPEEDEPSDVAVIEEGHIALYNVCPDSFVEVRNLSMRKEV